MIGPLPIDSAIELDLTAGDTPLHLSGIVRSSQAGFGMGIEFKGMSPIDYEKLRTIALPHARCSGAGPDAVAFIQHRNQCRSLRRDCHHQEANPL